MGVLWLMRFHTKTRSKVIGWDGGRAGDFEGLEGRRGIESSSGEQTEWNVVGQLSGAQDPVS